MATTTNYGWTTPNDTDLVKDGASAIRTLGSSIDTTTKALNPSTTLGDIEYRSATANTNTRLGIGTSGQVLAVNGSGVPAWATPAGAKSYSLLGSGTMSGATTVTISGISGIDEILVIFRGITNSSNSTTLYTYFNGDNGTNYDLSSFVINSPATYGDIIAIANTDSETEIELTRKSNHSLSAINGSVSISGCNTTGKKVFLHQSASDAGAGNNQRAKWGSGVYNSTSTISSISLKMPGTNFSGGIFRVYGAA
jgi:hypothetical protein